MMIANETAYVAAGEPQAVHEEVWLLGQPTLSKYLDFVEEMVVGAPDQRHKIVAEWSAANDRFREMEKLEAGAADTTEALDIPASLQPLVEAVEADSRYRRTFNRLPTRFAMVELDRLIIGHPYVSLHHVERNKRKISSSPTPAELFNFCIPLDRAEAPVRVRKLGSRRFLFWSASSDFRFMDAELLRPEQIEGITPFGAVSAAVGLFVGYGSNFVNLIQVGDRYLVHNGHHRLYALRDLGITHAPCIVQTVTRPDELSITASRAVLDDPGFYFESDRPPLLRDFFDPDLRKVYRVHSMANVVELSFESKLFKKVRDFGGDD